MQMANGWFSCMHASMNEAVDGIVWHDRTHSNTANIASFQCQTPIDFHEREPIPRSPALKVFCPCRAPRRNQIRRKAGREQGRPPWRILRVR